MLTIFEQLEQVLKSDVFLAFAGMAAGMALVFWVLNFVRPGTKPTPNTSEKPWIRALRSAGWFLIPLFAILFVATLGQITWMWTNQPGGTEPLALRVHYLALVGFIGVLGGILGALTAYIRIFTTERQTVAQEQGLITDRINKAVENLGAERTSSRIGRILDVKSQDGHIRKEIKWAGSSVKMRNGDEIDSDGDWQVFSESLPNLEVRIGAIYALERIARDNLDYHVQIMEILTAYVRENAKAKDPDESPRAVWLAAVESAKEEIDHQQQIWNDAVRNTGLTDESSLEETLEWAEALPALRGDIQTILTVIGRRTAAQKAMEATDTRLSANGYRVDLRKTHLRRADMSNLDFSGARFDQARIEGGNFCETQLEGADLSWANLEGANLIRARLNCTILMGAHLEEAVLRKARMNNADLRSARLDGARLRQAWLEGADLRNARLNGADLSEADLDGADLGGAMLYRARIRGAHFEGSTRLSSDQLKEVFGDGSVSLPHTIPPPAHWPTEALGLKNFLRERTLWTSDPTAYIRPEDRTEHTD